MGMTAVFIDGAYLEKVLLYDHGRPSINFELLAAAMINEGDELLRVYYYHCLPFKSNPPTIKENERYGNRRRFYDALGYIPRFEVRLGRLAFRGMDQKGDPIFQQKRVDLMLGVDMAILAGKQSVSKVVLLSGDSDFTPAVDAVKAEGVLTTVWYGSSSDQTRPSDDLLRACDERHEITSEDIHSILR